MQMRKCGKAGKARSRDPSNHRESTWAPGYSLSDTPAAKCCNHCLQSDFQQDMSEIKLARCYKITTKDNIPSAVPPLNPEGEVCL